MKQSKAIHKWKPWEKSSGPKTSEGKIKSSKNSFKHGLSKLEKEFKHIKKIRIQISLSK